MIVNLKYKHGNSRTRKKEARIKYFDNWASSYLFFNRKKLMKPTRQRRVFDDSELMIYYSIYSNVYSCHALDPLIIF